MATYRVILLFDAASDSEAIVKAKQAGASVKGTVDRVTIRRETWGPVEAESAPAAVKP